MRRPGHQVLVNGGTAGDDDKPSDGLHLGTRFVDLSDHVQRIRTVKTLAAPNGQFDLTLTFKGVDELGRASLNRVLLPDNAVLISLDAGLHETDLEEVMLGFITRVAERVTLDTNGRPQRAITVSGEDAGKFLVRHELPGQLVLKTILWGRAEEAQRLASGLQFSGPPGIVLRRAYEAIFQNLVVRPRAVAQGIRLVIDPRLEDPNTSYRYVADVWLRHGKFWNLFRELADQPWTELFADYMDLRIATASGSVGTSAPARSFTIVARPQPFDQADWDRLETVTVYDSEIRLHEMALSDRERVNLVLVAPDGTIRAVTDQNVEAIFFGTVQFSEDSAERHGTQPYPTVATKYSDLGGSSHITPTAHRDAVEGRGPIAQALRERAEKLWRWFAVNHILWSGVWVIAGDPRIHIGMRVQNQEALSPVFDPHDGERRTYYVEKVVHEYVDGQHFQTHLALTRGMPLGQFVAAPIPSVGRERAAIVEALP